MTWGRSLCWMVALVALDGVCVLPPPASVSMESVDMTHTLRWRPPQATCNTSILYSVQFQGEFELTVLSGGWVDAPECQWTGFPHCDLTFDLGSDSDYNLRVRARCGSRLSAWAQLRPQFNRRHTVLSAPNMTVEPVGGGLHVRFHKVPAAAVVMVTVRNTDNELQDKVYSVSSEEAELYVDALQEGERYCVRALAVFGGRLRSRSTDDQCVHITDAAAAWRTPAVAAVVTATLIMAGLLMGVSVARRRPDLCRAFSQKEPLPESLRDVRVGSVSGRLLEVSERTDPLRRVPER